jgi:putative transposase
MELRALIDFDHSQIAVRRQCELLGLNRSTLYYQAKPEELRILQLMKEIDEIYLNCPFFGSRKIVIALKRRGVEVNRKCVQRLMRLMGIEAIYSKPKTSLRRQDHKVYPYLLKGVQIVRPYQVWSVDITYLPTALGYVYLVAIIDWYSRYVVSWRLSNTMDSSFCVEALQEALERGKPEIFNSDQGSQFTSSDFVGILGFQGVKISMDGRGRAYDNIFTERLWRSVKYEEVYLKDYATMEEAYEQISRYFEFYNLERPHQSLDYQTPQEVHYACVKTISA